MAILMAGGAYCSLSLRDPKARLLELVKQTRSRVVFTHSLTKFHINNSIATIDVEIYINSEHQVNDADLKRLSNVAVTEKNIVYIVFTSGSTGVPKAVCRRLFDKCLLLFLLFLDSSATS
jgi:non-ribosomal peptide synthetase component F